MNYPGGQFQRNSFQSPVAAVQKITGARTVGATLHARAHSHEHLENQKQSPKGISEGWRPQLSPSWQRHFVSLWKSGDQEHAQSGSTESKVWRGEGRVERKKSPTRVAVFPLFFLPRPELICSEVTAGLQEELNHGTSVQAPGKLLSVFSGSQKGRSAGSSTQQDFKSLQHRERRRKKKQTPGTKL